MGVRLNTFLARATALSRRAADRAIAAGEVEVNGRRVDALGLKVDPKCDRVLWHGKQVMPTREKICLAFYKPRHVVVTKSDPQGRPTIWRWLEPYAAECNAAGRLDYESEGLLLITNDGMLIERLTHPRFGVAKRYHVKVDGIPDDAKLARLTRGARVAGVIYQPVDIRRLRSTEENGWLEMTLTEGKYREIRALCAAIGHLVLKLRRVAVGPIKLGTLRPGQARKLRSNEIAELNRIFCR
ncbi:MAG: rRNA pseudouridine synthase [Deltaproteobacteria bacterium]|nr:rRNA pseudouridine synthase [Deltaproteobacteria bacterium]